MNESDSKRRINLKNNFLFNQKILCNQMEKKWHQPFWKDFGLAQSPPMVAYVNNLEIQTVLPGAILYFHFENYKLIQSENQNKF